MHLQPLFYRNILLRGIDPKDKENYPLHVLVQDVFAMGPGTYNASQGCPLQGAEYYLNSVLGTDGRERSEAELEEEFRAAVVEDFVTHRRLALDALREGLTLARREINEQTQEHTLIGRCLYTCFLFTR